MTVKVNCDLSLERKKTKFISIYFVSIKKYFLKVRLYRNLWYAIRIKERNHMKYPIDTIVMINNREWRVAEYRMGRGREWIYTMSNENTDGSYETMRLNETAIGKIMLTEPQGEMPYTAADEVFA